MRLVPGLSSSIVPELRVRRMAGEDSEILFHGHNLLYLRRARHLRGPREAIIGWAVRKNSVSNHDFAHQTDTISGGIVEYGGGIADSCP